MFSMALWVLDQEYKAGKWLMAKSGSSYVDSNPDKMSAQELFAATVFGIGAVAQTGLIGSTGYSQVFRMHDRSVRYIVNANWDAKVPKGFSIGRRGISPIWRTAGMKGSARYAAAKLGSRFIPYVGIGLLMLDAWHVGKWIGEKTNPFNS